MGQWNVGKGKEDLITEVIFTSIKAQKMCQIPILNFSTYTKKVEHSYLAHFFGDETKMKLPSKLSHL